MKPFYLVLLLAWVASSCSHAPTSLSKTDSTPASADWEQTSVDIHYVLRHSERRLLIEADQQNVRGLSSVEGSQLKHCQIDVSRYQQFLTKAKDFVQHQRTLASTPTPAAPSPDCRAPYTIVLKNPKDTVQIHGCRTKDEGAFSHLVQDGEFLIYRQK
jgi:hypothetical protein